VVPLEILKIACREVYKKTKDLIGTNEGNRKLRIGAGGDWSRKIDIEAEDAVITTIKKYNFSPTVMGEECGRIIGDEGFLIMDALDGTTNASMGLPFYCCSLAYASGFKLSSVLYATVIDLVSGDIYAASKNRGAYMNENEIHVGTRNRLDHELLIGMNISRSSTNELKMLSNLISLTDHARLLGANALELCYLAKGSLDAYIDLRTKIRATDMAAAYLIVREAGGNIYSINGAILDSELEVNSRMSFIAVANDDIYNRISKSIVPGT
jgi:myo-inositol-1(or 4)-monophosphatase